MKIVIKVGTSTLAHATGHLNIRHMEALCRVISDIKNAGHKVILVSSGAIGMGVGKLNLKKRPESLPEKQAAAAVGQCELMYTYDKLFAEYNHTVAQILLTGEDIADEKRRQNFENTVEKLLDMEALPIINENDTIATEEIVIGDNDTLGAVAAKCMGADLLVILSDIDGLYTADPHTDKSATLISEVSELNEDIMLLGGNAGTSLGTGGMKTKLHAAEIATNSGCDMIIANGKDPAILYDIIEGKPIGTRFRGMKK